MWLAGSPFKKAARHISGTTGDVQRDAALFGRGVLAEAYEANEEHRESCAAQRGQHALVLTGLMHARKHTTGGEHANRGAGVVADVAADFEPCRHCLRVFCGEGVADGPVRR